MKEVKSRRAICRVWCNKFMKGKIIGELIPTTRSFSKKTNLLTKHTFQRVAASSVQVDDVKLSSSLSSCPNFNTSKLKINTVKCMLLKLSTVWFHDHSLHTHVKVLSMNHLYTILAIYFRLTNLLTQINDRFWNNHGRYENSKASFKKPHWSADNHEKNFGRNFYHRRNFWRFWFFTNNWISNL